MTPDEWIKLLRENAQELGQHVRRLKIGDVEIDFASPEPTYIEPEVEHTSNDPLFDPSTYQGGYVPVRRE